MQIIDVVAHTSSNNMLTGIGLLDRGVLLASCEKASEEFLKEIDLEQLFAVEAEQSDKQAIAA